MTFRARKAFSAVFRRKLREAQSFVAAATWENAAFGGEKHARRAAPIGAKLSERKVSKFFALLFVLYKK